MTLLLLEHMIFHSLVACDTDVGVWLEFVQHSIGAMGQPDGLRRVREAFERAVTAVGLHTVKGSMVWEAYREFENAILLGLQVRRQWRGKGKLVTATCTQSSQKIDKLHMLPDLSKFQRLQYIQY